MPALLTRIETAPSFFADLRGDGAAGRVIGHVERKILRLAARIADFGGRARRRLAVDVERCDLRSFAGKSNRDRAADPGARAGDRRDVVLQECCHAGCSAL